MAPTLHLERPDVADARDEVRFGTLNGRRVAVWPGAPPKSVDHEVVATVLSLDGVHGGADHYAEAIPTGIRLVEHEPPPDIARYVVARLLRGLAALHDAGEIHGRIDERRVVLGHDGEVVLIGRGRRKATAGHDVIATIALLPASAEITMPGSTAAVTAEVMEQSLPRDGQERLAAWVCEMSPPPLPVDEVVPDLGDERDQTGLLDRYEGTEVGAPSVDEGGDEDSSTQMNVGQTLWRALAAPPVNEPPPNRFAAVEGVPSDAIADLLSGEKPLLVSLPAIGPVDSFVVDAPLDNDPDYESSNTVKAPLIEIAAAEAAVRARRDDSTTLPLPGSPYSDPHFQPLPPEPPAQVETAPAKAPEVAPSRGLRVLMLVVLVIIAAGALAVILGR